MKITSRIGFIGGGNMAGALIEGLLKQGRPANEIHVIDISEQTCQNWKTHGLSVSREADQVLEDCAVWVLAVKPQQLHQVIQLAKPYLKKGTLVLSIAAGISLSTLSQWLGTSDQPWPSVVRAMPNTPALIGQGVTGLACVPSVQAQDKQTASSILSTVSQVVWVQNDEQIDAVTALSGSGPAYVFRFIEGLIAGGTALGLDATQARTMAIATVTGAAALAAHASEPIEILRERVTSKGGTTAAALDVMENRDFHETVVVAMQAAYRRAGELSEEFGKLDAK